MDTDAQSGGAKQNLKIQVKSKAKNKKNENSTNKSNKLASELGKSSGKNIIKIKNKEVKKNVNKKNSKDVNEKSSKSKSEKTSKSNKKKVSSKSVEKKISKNKIIDFTNSNDDSKNYDYQNIIINYDINKNKSLNVLTQYEISVIIGKRASQIAMGAAPLIKVSSNMNHIEIAEEELRQKKTPFIIKREIGQTAEYWRIEDLELSDVI